MSMTFLSLAPSIDIAKCKVNMLKLLSSTYISFEKKANASVLFWKLTIKTLEQR